jgi:hypothetical protein
LLRCDARLLRRDVGLMSDAVGEAADPSARVEVVQRRFDLSRCPLDRRPHRSHGSYRSAHLITADEPDRRDRHSSEEQQGERREQHDAEAERPQQAGYEEPDSGKGESALTQLLSIGWALERSRPRHEISP